MNYAFRASGDFNALFTEIVPNFVPNVESSLERSKVNRMVEKTEYGVRVRNTECGVRSAEYGVRSAKYGIGSTEYGVCLQSVFYRPVIF